MLLMGDHWPIQDLPHSENVNLDLRKWSLEDEYENRRREFYYRCAGADIGNISDFDNNDEKLSDNTALNSGYPLFSSKEWAAEKRHWLERLAQYRAAALDKWIRTAAEAKQAVGDVYGYRALMSALCSDRVI